MTRVTMDFGRGLDWPALLSHAKELDVFLAYGRTWRSSNEASLREIASRKDARVRVVLPDPDHADVISELSRRFRMSAEEVRRRIKDAEVDFRRMFEPIGAQFSLTFTDCTPVFSFYRIDHCAVVATYKHVDGRGAVPTFVVEKGGSMYAFVEAEFEYLSKRKETRPCRASLDQTEHAASPAPQA